MVDGMSLYRPGVTLKQVEKEFVLGAYAFFHQNKTATANALGVSVRTIDNKLERYQKEDANAKAVAEKGRLDREDFERRARGTVVRTADGYDALAALPTPKPDLRVTSPAPVRVTAPRPMPDPETGEAVVATAAAVVADPPPAPARKKVVPKPLPVPRVARARR